MYLSCFLSPTTTQNIQFYFTDTDKLLFGVFSGIPNRFSKKQKQRNYRVPY